MGQVRVIFHGVCTHFIGVVPGVPQRVVLPDASAFRIGLLRVPGHGQGSYALMPHFPILRLVDAAVQDQINIPTVIDRGNIVDSVHLQIANAVGPQPDLTAQDVPSLRAYVHDYVYSEDVVTGGRAGAYFDIHHAAAEAVQHLENGGREVVVTVETEGKPILRATPFFGGTPHDFPLIAPGDQAESVNLWVANQGMDCDTDQNNFDFVLHFLTERAGIPQNFTRMPFGLMTPSLDLVPHATFNELADFLKTLDYPARFDTPCFQLQPHPVFGQVLITSAACSNSTYP